MAAFHVGTVMARSFSVWGRNLPAFALIGILVESPVILHEIFGDTKRGSMSSVVISMFFPVGLAWIASALVSYGAFESLRGRRWGVGATLMQGLRRVFAVIGIGIISLILIVGTFIAALWVLQSFVGMDPPEGFVELGAQTVLVMLAGFIPGTLVASALWFATPAAVIEHAGTGRAILRSLALTKGSRLRIFVLLAVLLMVIYGVWLSGAFLAGRLLRSVGHGNWYRLAMVTQIVIRGIMDTLGGVAAVVGYYEVRRQSEHVDVEEIAAVFD